ncbi:type II toxin-antitoxin system PemK/MazF family toxin [Flavobacterium caseinilyticum]|uniref:Type II toxin-antitoxin system PemK/MazF family toxin n=1 Tax=Flavobacterium caseinilyticum TaxID=2541732 RepID=A0A4R5B1N4_9FLAO|nr:type II toxin-antitoxin system PemK/MazF family toxin [Flavobacterium caseinilyticum]TDD78066.1 type II toxin-antitoxin system PemK/MazF family toxin [Flavobacterium caseinilyticum]
MTNYKKWDIVMVVLNPTKGSEISKTRPCLVVSPNSINTYLNTIIVVPFTSKPRGYPFRILTNHKNSEGELCFDHIKSFDNSRIVKTDGTIAKTLRTAKNNLLFEFFNE